MKYNLRAVRHSGNIGRPAAKTGVNMTTHFDTFPRQLA
jgi:hypothetical protein